MPLLRTVACLALSLAALAAHAAETETIQLGVYGTRWLPWVLENPRRVDFFIYQGTANAVGRAGADFTALRDAGVDVVWMRQIYRDADERFLRSEPRRQISPEKVAEETVEALWALGAAAPTVVSIDEENVWWGGREAFLSQVYEQLKRRDPKRAYMQWFFDGGRPRAPLGNRQRIPADGWVVDPYLSGLAHYEAVLRPFLKTGKPVLSVVWASPHFRLGGRPKGIDRSWWNEQGWRTFIEQVGFNQAHNIDTAFFIYGLQPDPRERLEPGWASQDPCLRAFTARFFEETLPYLRQHRIATAPSASRPVWLPSFCPS